MKIKEITYASGRVEYVCVWYKYEMNDVSYIMSAFTVVVFMLAALSLKPAAVYVLFGSIIFTGFSFVVRYKKEFINSYEAFRFRDLYYESKRKKTAKKEQMKEASRLRSLNRKKVSTKTISRS